MRSIDRFERTRMLKRAQVLVDTRERETPALNRRMENIKLPYRREKLDAGDYGIATTFDDGTEYISRTIIERKMNLDELCMCFTRERRRFEAEFRRIIESGLSAWLLIENGNWEKAASGVYRSKMSPESLLGSIFAWAQSYGIRPIMCKSETSPILIRQILTHALSAELIQMEAEEENINEYDSGCQKEAGMGRCIQANL